jgi:hypothetical protein
MRQGYPPLSRSYTLPTKFPLLKRDYYTLPPLQKGDTGGFLKSPLTPLYERGEGTGGNP